MKILWVKIGGLWPVDRGGRLRSFHILAELSKRHEVSVVTTHSPDENALELNAHLPRCKQVISVPHKPAKHGSSAFFKALVQSWFSSMPVDLYKNQVEPMQQAVRQLLNDGDYDLCIADFLFALPNLPRRLSIPLVVFSHNVEYMIWQRLCQNETSWLKKLALQIEWRKLRHYEVKACERADLTITVSDADRDHFLQLTPRSQIQSVPTGVDIDYFKPAPAATEAPYQIVFCGSMDWFPNEDAMLWFCETMLPAIRAKMPNARLTIIGRNPGARVQALADAHRITVTGTVDDVRPHVEPAAVYIVPLRIGGGTRLKIFEALAMGKAIVSTTVGAEGLPLEDGKHILLADTPELFAEKVVALLRHPGARQQLGMAGRQLVESRYSWSRVTDYFDDLCQQACEPVSSSTSPSPLLSTAKGTES